MRMRRLLWIIPVIILVAIAGFVLWASAAPAPMPTAEAALEDDALVDVNTDGWLVFQPLDAEINPSTGFIFYPGGRVTAASYAPALRAIAEAGYLVVAVPMPLNLAVLSPAAADGVIEAYPDIEHWVIGGHSLGGAMAANYVKGNAAKIDGLVLWASYPQASDTLAENESLVVGSVYATNDGLASVEDVEGSRAYLPGDAEFFLIEGGNHAYFGWYGEQGGDLEATITREEQQAQVVAATLEILNRVAPAANDEDENGTDS